MTLNQNSVFERFAVLTNLTDEEAARYLSFSASAKVSIERLLKREIADENELYLVTDCAAKKAFYDYTLLCASTPRIFSTTTGSVFARLADDVTVDNAKNLWLEAMSLLPKDLISDSEFVFSGVRG